MKKLLVFAAALAPALLAAQETGWMTAPGSNPVFTRMNTPEGQSGPVAGKPFSATEVRHTQQVLADGTHVDHTDTSQFYRDDRGRMRTGNDTNVLILDPVGGFTYSLNLKAKTYTKSPTDPRGGTYSIAVTGNRTSTSYSYSTGTGAKHTLQRLEKSVEKSSGRANQQTTVTEDLPPQFLNGVQAKGSRITVTIPAGTFGNDRDVKVVNERWYSDDLQVLLKSSNSDPRFGVTTYEITNLLQGPPDPSLFVVPADFTLRPTGGPVVPHSPLH